MEFASKRGFTLVELIIVIFLLTVGLSAIIFALHRGSSFVQTTRQKVVAINLAREGMEGMYNIRGTNRQRWAGKKDKCRLKIDPLNATQNDPNSCTDDDWIQSGHYILLQSGQGYFMLSGIVDALNLDDGVGSGDFAYSLCEAHGQWFPCPNQYPESVEGMFWRQIVVKGLFLKDVVMSGGQAIDCVSGDDTNTNCGSGVAKELHFCSRVGYQGEGHGIVELCGVMTNFFK